MSPPEGQHRADNEFVQWDAAPDGRYAYEEMPTDPSMPAPLNYAPRPAQSVPGRYQDLVVPRVYVEPDEYMDHLRERAFRWAIGRDIIACIVGLLVIGWFVMRILAA